MQPDNVDNLFYKLKLSDAYFARINRINYNLIRKERFLRLMRCVSARSKIIFNTIDFIKHCKYCGIFAGDHSLAELRMKKERDRQDDQFTSRMYIPDMNDKNDKFAAVLIVLIIIIRMYTYDDICRKSTM